MEPSTPLPLGEQPSMPATVSPVKRRRTAASTTDCCRTCRLRKVKCTGDPGQGPCANCSRLELQCSFVNPNGTWTPSDKVSRTTPSHIHTEAGTLRKRAQRACRQCHAHKTKCSGDLPRCKRCDAAGLTCEYIPAKRKFASVPTQAAAPSPNPPYSGQPSPVATTSVKSDDPLLPVGPDSADNGGGSSSSSINGVISGSSSNAAPTSASSVETGHFPLAVDTSMLTAEELLTRKDLLLQHVDVYLEHLYWLPSLGFLHPETTYRQIHDGTLEPSLGAAVCAVASIFVSPGPAGREFRNKCSDEVEFHLFRNMHKFDQKALIIFALNCAYNFFQGNFAKVWQCFGVATRLMLGLQANWDVVPRSGTFAEQETLRRIVWHIFNVDRLLAGGYDEYITSRVEHTKIRLPCNEESYRANRPVIAERLHDKPGRAPGTVGLQGHQIRIVDIKHRIQVYTRKLEASLGPNRQQVEPSKVMATINGFQSELSRIIVALPDDLKLSDQGIALYMNSPERYGYVHLHTNIAASHIDLYRFSLPGLREKSVDLYRKLPREFVAKSQKQAVAHAISLARLCERIQKEVEKYPKNGRLNTAGDVTIIHVASQCLRILLVATQHDLYRDLADHSTAPLYRNEPADEAQIRGLVDSLLGICEPWCEYLSIVASAHQKNKKMVREFYKTRKFRDQKMSSGLPEDATVRLPGAHFILERAHAGTLEEEQRSRAGDAAAAARWFSNSPQPTIQAPLTPCFGGYTAQDTEADSEFAPPGVPMFLAHAMRPTDGTSDGSLWFDPDDEMVTLSTKMWQMPELDLMSGNQQLMTTDAGPVMQMSSAPGPQLFCHAQSVPPPSQQFIQTPPPPPPPPPHAMYMGDYAAHFQNGHSQAHTPYMQQNGFK